MISIYYMSIDAAGNQGWVLLNTVPMLAQDALAYIQALRAADGRSYMAQMVDGVDQTIIAQVP